MTAIGIDLPGRILSELDELTAIVARVRQAWSKAEESQDEFFLDSVALNLHGFYSGLERVFERIAGAVDESVPGGANWHQELLNQMAQEISGKRPAVISLDLKNELEAYRGFRHVVRNVYAIHMNPQKIAPLVEDISRVLTTAKKEITAFAEFLRHRVS